MDDWGLELEAAYSASCIGSPDQADPSQELTSVDIVTSFSSSSTQIGMGSSRTSYAPDAYFALIDLYFVLT